MESGLISALILKYSYAFMVPAVMFLGPAVSLVAGILLRLGYVELLPVCLALAAGELGGDILWYSLGRRYGESFTARFGRFVGITPSSVESIKKLFNYHHDLIIFGSKLTSGFGFSLVIFFTAGMARVPFRRYIVLNIVGQIIWTTALLSAGYYLGHFYLEITGAFEKMTFIAGVIMLFAVAIGFGRYVRARLLSR